MHLIPGITVNEKQRRCLFRITHHKNSGGIVARKERWSLSRRGWLIVLAAVLAIIGLFLFRVYSFWAVTHRVDANVLVVEGWVHEYAIRAAVEEFRSNRYERVTLSRGRFETIVFVGVRCLPMSLQ
jgi:hypothetical protein